MKAKSTSRNRKVTNLNEFISWVKELPKGEHLFRGLSKESYLIEASAMRRLPKEDQNTAKLLKLNQELIEKTRMRGHDRKNGQKLSDLELLAELQHHGAATCLIDFTENALLALWFACQPNTGEQKDGQVVALRSDDISRFKEVTHDLLTEKKIDYFFQLDDGDKSQLKLEKMQSEKGGMLTTSAPADKHYPLYKWRPKHTQNSRIAAQHSIFIFGGQQIVANDTCIILRDKKEKILKELDEISNINEATTFPDFEGFARLYAHDKLYIKPDVESYLQRAFEAVQRGDLIKAIEYYDEVIKIDEGNKEAYNNQGLAKYKLGKYREAIADYDKAIELDPQFVHAYFNRGIAKNNIDDHGEAIVDYDKAIEFNPQFIDAYFNRGASKNIIGQHQEAINDFDDVIRFDPKSADAHYSRGFAKSQLPDMNYGEDLEQALILAKDQGLTKLAQKIQRTLGELNRQKPSAQ